MIDALKQNIETEIEILREISNNIRRMDYANPSERKLLQTSIESLRSSMKLINNSMPKMLDDITIATKLAQKARDTKLEAVEFQRSESTMYAVLKTEDREKFLKELSINEGLLKKLKKKKVGEVEKIEELKAARGYIKMSNRFFLDKSQELISKGYFKSLSVELKKTNMEILFAAYVAMMLFSTTLAIFSSIILFVLLLVVGAPILYIIWIPFLVPIGTFLLLYIYPSTEKDSLAKRIDQELPFAVIHMSAISGSGIEPTEIFKIIGMSKEYPYLRKEIRKVLNQINLHGYDLVTAINNVAKSTSSTKLSELLSGLSTTITSGGKLGEFFDKRSETLLNSYRLEREKYTKVAETFMDMYISVVIAAPMILMILLVMISVSSIDTGFSPEQMTFLIILVVAVINGLFLLFLRIKQPIY